MYTVFTYHGTVEGFFTGISGYAGSCCGHAGRDCQFTRFGMHTGFTDHGAAEDFLTDIDGCTCFHRGLTGRDSGFTKFVIHAGPWEQEGTSGALLPSEKRAESEGLVGQRQSQTPPPQPGGVPAPQNSVAATMPWLQETRQRSGLLQRLLVWKI